METYLWYSGPCILRPHVQPEEYGLKLKVGVEMDGYTENIIVVLLDGQSPNGAVLNRRDHCTRYGGFEY